MEYLQTVINHLPHAPGVYVFKNSDGVVLYVGKAKDLKNRVSTYAKDRAIGEKTRLLVAQSSHLDIIRTNSEFDALILEASCIRAWQPKYNVIAKDDKSPLYVRMTLSEALPRVLLVRKPQAVPKKDVVVGPFPSSRIARNLLRQIRSVIPFCTQNKRDGKPCFYTHINLCDPCPSYIEKLPQGTERAEHTRRYRNHMLLLKNLLMGKALHIRRALEREMKSLAAGNRFEEAAAVRNHLTHLTELLERQYDPSLYFADSELTSHIGSVALARLREALQPYYPQIHALRRIECFDISNVQGTSATGGMTVATEGTLENSQYRKFRVHLAPKPNDVAMMREVLKRRFNHPEWPFPELLVVDGGKPQTKAALSIVGQLSQPIPVIGLAKRREEIIVPCDRAYRVLRMKSGDPGLHLLERLRDEAHRFAHTYHTLLRSRTYAINK